MCATAIDPRPITLAEPTSTVLVAATGVSAGYPSPAQDYAAESLDLNSHLIRDRVSSFILRVAGNSMIRAGIFDGDEIIVDRGLNPHDGDIVIAVVDGEFTIKRFIDAGDHGYLHPENPEYPDIPLGPDSDFFIWGVVTHCLHKLR